MPTAQKAAVIDELAGQLDRSQLTIVADYRGLKVTDLQGLRTSLRPLDAECRVSKNTLTLIAANRVGIEGMDEVLAGPTALVMAYGDVVGVSKAVSDFARTSRILTVRGGVMNNRVLAPQDVEAIASLPPREELLGRLVGMLVSPISRTLGVLGGPGRSLAYVLQARADQLGGGDTAEAAAD